VAEVWFVSPTTGGIKRRMFVTGDCIAEAFKFANEISNESAHQPTALVKFRKGEMKGNRHVLLCTPDGYIVTPQTIVEWHGRNRLKAGVGEKISNLSLKVLKAMLAQNAEIRKAFGTTVDKHGTLKVCMGGCLDIPTLEPKDSKAVEYSLRMVSGDSRIIDIRPRTDKKDEDEDPGMSALHAAFLEGHMERDAYEERAGMLAEQLAVAQWEEDNPGRTAAQARYQNELVWARDEGIISEDSFEFMQSWSHPSHRDNKSGPTMWQRKTRVEYGKDGRMVWQRAKNDNTPGARWVGGQSVHEAQLYAQNR
jgi:hypothetical protein